MSGPTSYIDKYLGLAREWKRRYTKLSLSCSEGWALEVSAPIVRSSGIKNCIPKAVIESYGHASYFTSTGFKTHGERQAVSIGVRQKGTGPVLTQDLNRRRERVRSVKGHPVPQDLQQHPSTASPNNLFVYDGDHSYLAPMFGLQSGPADVAARGIVTSDNINASSRWTDAGRQLGGRPGGSSGPLPVSRLTWLGRRKVVGFATAEVVNTRLPYTRTN